MEFRIPNDHNIPEKTRDIKKSSSNQYLPNDEISGISLRSQINSSNRPIDSKEPESSLRMKKLSQISNKVIQDLEYNALPLENNDNSDFQNNDDNDIYNDNYDIGEGYDNLQDESPKKKPLSIEPNPMPSSDHNIKQKSPTIVKEVHKSTQELPIKKSKKPKQIDSEEPIEDLDGKTTLKSKSLIKKPRKAKSVAQKQKVDDSIIVSKKRMVTQIKKTGFNTEYNNFGYLTRNQNRPHPT
jgi:hypothetical protein